MNRCRVSEETAAYDLEQSAKMMTVREEMERDKLLARVRELMVDDLVEYRHVGWMEYDDSQVSWEADMCRLIGARERGFFDDDHLGFVVRALHNTTARNIVWKLTCELDTNVLKDLEEQEFRDAWLKSKLS